MLLSTINMLFIPIPGHPYRCSTMTRKEKRIVQTGISKIDAHNILLHSLSLAGQKRSSYVKTLIAQRKTPHPQVKKIHTE